MVFCKLSLLILRGCQLSVPLIKQTNDTGSESSVF